MLCPYALEDPLTADAQTCEGVRSLADSFAAGTFLEGEILCPSSSMVLV